MVKRFFLRFILHVVLVASSFVAYGISIPQTVDVEKSIQDLKKNVHKKVFDNGFTVLFYRKENTPELFMQIAYGIGSKDERQDEYGYAHLVEHMIFKGTQKLSERDIFEIARKYSASANAYTSYDQTRYFFDTDNKNWKLFIDIFADCMQNVRFGKDQLISELGTIFQEIKLGDMDSAGNILGILFPANHPYNHPIVGYKEHLLTMDLDKAKAFYKKMYSPDRAVLIVVGDLDPSEVFSVVEKHFGSIKQSKEKGAIIHDFLVPKKELSQKHTTIFKTVSTPSTTFFWAIPGSNDKDSEIISCISSILSIRLGRNLSDNRQWVHSVNADNYAFLLDGVFNISMVPKTEESFFSKVFNLLGFNWGSLADRCKREIERELIKVIENGFTEGELARYKRQIVVRFFDSFDYCNSIASGLSNSLLIHNNEYYFFECIEKLDKINNKEIKRVAYAYLRPILMNSITYLPFPDKKEEANWLELQKKVDIHDAELLARQKRFAELESFKFAERVPNPELVDETYNCPDVEFDLSNGLHVVFKQKSETPFIVAQLEFKNVDDLDYSYLKLRKAYISDLVTMMISEGSKGFSKNENEDFFRALGAEFSGFCFKSLKDCFDTVAQRALHIISNPLYSRDVFNERVTSIKDYIEMDKKSPSSVANYLCSKKFFEGTFLFTSHEEDRESLDSIRRSDLFEYHKKYVNPDHLFLTIVGDCEKEDISARLEKIFGKWHSCSDAKIEHVEVPDVQNPKSSRHDEFFPCEELIVMACRLTVTEDDPDYFALHLLDSYINRELFDIRQRTGVFYGISGLFTSGATEKQKGIAEVQFSTTLEMGDEAEKLVREKIAEIIKKGISTQDLAVAKQQIVMGLAKAFTTNDSLVSIYVDLYSKGKPWNYPEIQLKKFEEVTLEQANNALKKYLDLSEWSFIRVGRVGEKKDSLL